MTSSEGASFIGKPAEVAFWTRVLDSTELANRMGGLLSSCISPGLVHYWPLTNSSTLTDLGSGGENLHCRPANTCTEVGTRTDSSITGAGYSGIYFDDTTVRLDDFGSGTFVATGGGQGGHIIGGSVCRGGIIE